MFDTRNVIEKLQNCNGFFTTHRYPPWLRFREDKQFSFNFRQRREAFINTDTRRFKIQTSDMWPLPPRQSLSTKSHVITHDNFAFRKGLIVSGLMHNNPRAMLVWTHEYYFKLMFFVCLFNRLFTWFFDWWFIDWLPRKRGLCMFVYVVKTTSILVMRDFDFR